MARPDKVAAGAELTEHFRSSNAVVLTTGRSRRPFLTRIFRRGSGRSYENALRPGMIGVADNNQFPRVRRAFSWFKVAV